MSSTEASAAEQSTLKAILTRLNNVSMDPDVQERDFYRAAMTALDNAGLPYLVGGAYAFAQYSGIARHTKDFDIFVRKEDAERILKELATTCGCKTDKTFPHWLYKALLGENFIDVIFSSGNGVAEVDESWFTRSRDAVVLGLPCKIIPAEELIWSKSFIMERERFDGADIVHTIHGYGKNMDWKHLIARFGDHWRVLYSHVVLFQYVYPGEMDKIPDWVVQELTQRVLDELAHKPAVSKPLCQGTFISREQYLRDISEWGYDDARTCAGNKLPATMSENDVAHWTAAINHGGTGKP